ncbi:unnamed protein product, partial [Rotaria sp. Silwood1]
FRFISIDLYMWETRFLSIGRMIIEGKHLMSYEIRSLTTSVELCFICEWMGISGEGRNV